MNSYRILILTAFSSAVIFNLVSGRTAEPKIQDDSVREVSLVNVNSTRRDQLDLASAFELTNITDGVYNETSGLYDQDGEEKRPEIPEIPSNIIPGTTNPDLNSSSSSELDVDTGANSTDTANETVDTNLDVVDTRSNHSSNSSTSIRCPLFSIPCRDGSHCVPFHRFCDLNPDCPDGSDEGPSYCKQGVAVLVCADGQLIQGHNVRCDGFADCDDGSDESNCYGYSILTPTLPDPSKLFLKECPWQYQFQCSEGTCIDKSKVCDGFYDCPFGVDESVNQCALKKSLNEDYNEYHMLSAIKHCSSYQSYICQNGQIVIANRDIKCNGVYDCADTSDEAYCYDGDKGEEEEGDSDVYGTSTTRHQHCHFYLLMVSVMGAALIMCFAGIVAVMYVNRRLRALLAIYKKRHIVLSQTRHLGMMPQDMPQRPPSYSQIVKDDQNKC